MNRFMGSFMFRANGQSPSKKFHLVGLACLCFISVLHAQVVLPADDQSFSGKIDPDVRRSAPAWPAKVAAAKGAPNVVLILVDDVGFSTTSTFGGPVATPNFDKLAARGLRYNEF